MPLSEVVKTSRWTSLALMLALGWICLTAGVGRAEPVTTGPQLLGVCQTLLGEQSSFCDVITDWSVEKTVDTTLAEQPTRRSVGYTIRVIEGQTRYVLGMTSVVTLDGLIPDGTQVRGIVVNLQKADPNDPNYDPLDPLAQPRHTTVASALVGDTDAACGCPYVAPSQAGGLNVTLRDQLGNVLQPGVDALVDDLAYGERLVVQLDAVYDLSAGIVLPGDSVRIQACVQYALADEAGESGCFDAGGVVRSVRTCRGFDFAAYAQPRSARVKLEESLAAPSHPWIVVTGFRARSLSELIAPADLFSVIPGGAPVEFEVTASGSPGTESVVSVKGNVSCGDVVSCDGPVCTGTLANTATLDFQDARGRVSSSVSTQIICTPHQCSATELASCDDGDPCTTDTCVVGQGCVNTPWEGACDDGDACTTGEMCVGGVCTGGVTTGACADDNNPCTDEFCDPVAGCVRVVKPNRSRCEDGNACTVDDVCMEGQCVAGAAVACDDGNACTIDTCGPDGRCVFTPFAGAANSCDDGDPCTVGDRCGGGTCQAGSARTCAADGNACTSDACVPMLGCVYAPVANNTTCSDGNACTVADRCVAGTCVPGGPASCDDGNACTNDGCDAELGCFHAPRIGSCDDGNACTSTSACVEGSCRGSGAVSCDDGNPCTVDSCDPVLGCRNIALGNGTQCSDGDPCTSGDVCQGGTCMPTSATTCDDQNQCTTSTCVPDVGCVHVPRTGTCEDGNRCTGPDVCSGTTCTSGAAVTCDDGNPCTRDLCDPATGCQFLPLSVGSCDDGNLCTGDGTCVAGQCATGSPLSCEDGNPCTAGTCDPVMGCVQTPVGGTCDDGNACTGNGTCRAGVCEPGTALSCDDGNACTADACVPGLGCQNVPRNDVPCNDNNLCTVDDRCVQGTCVGGAPKNCDDGNACTLDTCGLEKGCVHTPTAGGCNDGNACTVGDTCVAGRCVSGAAKTCDDGNPCTADACASGTGLCVHTAIAEGDVCNDGDACSGCPWPEPAVRRGWVAADATPDATLWPGVPKVGFELDGFLGPGTGKAQLLAGPDLRFVVLPNGTAALRGTLKVTVAGAVEAWDVSMSFVFRGVGRAGQGATPFHELPTSVQSTPYTDHWEYWTLSSGATLNRVTPSADSATLGPDSSLQALPWQMGLRANGRNLGYGAAMPIRWVRGTRSGSGVIRLDLRQVFCLDADTCRTGTCVGGTESTQCRDLLAGDYCTYDERDFGASCSGSPSSGACILSSNFSLIGNERTACSTTQRGVAFGFTGFRRWGFLTAARIDLFMPTSGSGTTLTDLCNPLATTATPFVGKAFALDLSIRLSESGATPAPGGVSLGDLILSSGPCAGISLRELSRRAEAVSSQAPTGASTCNTQAVLESEVARILSGFRNCAGLPDGVVLPQ